MTLIKYAIGFIISFAIRLVPFRPANVEPIMSTTMPFGKKYGWLGGFAFAFLSIVAFDLFTGKVGLWTWITGAAYGVVGIGAAFFLKNRNKTKHYVGYAFIATLFYDAVTGLSVGPLFFSQPLSEAFIGQIPFTLRHVASNIIFAATISPLLHKWLISNQTFETQNILAKLRKVIG